MDKHKESGSRVSERSEASNVTPLEETVAIAGGCLEMGDAGVTAEESLEAEENFLANKIRRAEEWQEELKKREEADLPTRA